MSRISRGPAVILPRLGGDRLKKGHGRSPVPGACRSKLQQIEASMTLLAPDTKILGKLDYSPVT